MSLKDILSPFYVWKRAFEKPFTTMKPLEERPGAPRYRGFHTNDVHKCIGCGTCEAICQNAAIDMVPDESQKTTLADSGLRPRIDYGRCCWCALCVDICPTKSLGMSNEYIWVDSDADVFRFTPGIDEKPWQDSELGYKRSEKYTLLSPDRVKMPAVAPDKGITSFIEMIQGYSKEQAIKEADRCVECGLCVASCPGHMDIPEYIRAVREDDLERGLKVLYQCNPLPSVCGRVCTRKCEEVCAMSRTGEPVAIRWLKRYIADQISLDDYKTILKTKSPDNGKKVVIIGAGPGGITAAFYLSMLGYDITMYEANEKAGGMLRYGIPEYRLPYNQLDKDIEHILSLGVKIHYNKRVGVDVEFKELYDNFDAVFFSTGLPDPYSLGIKNEDHPKVMSGLKVLDDVTKGVKVDFGKDVAVIGGGNVAMDAARTARREGCEVTILYRRREVDMPADDEEIHEAKEENVNLIVQAIPLEIKTREDGRLDLLWGKAKMVDQGPDKRPKPVLIEDETYTNTFDSIVTALGQMADLSYIPEKLAEKIGIARNKIKIDEYGRTGDPKVFAGGDIANKTKDAISAIADGHKAARGIDMLLG